MSQQGALIDGAADPCPEQWGKTTVEERSQSGIGIWPGVITEVNPPNASLRLYGGAAFERVMHEFRCAAYSIECPPVSREKVIDTFHKLMMGLKSVLALFYLSFQILIQIHWYQSSL